MIRLGRKFLLPEYPSTRAEARPYRRMARRSLIEIYDAESEPLKHFERQFNRAFDPLQIPSVERGGVEKSMAALDRAGSDAVETCNRAALEESLDILREAIRFAHSSHNLTQIAGRKRSTRLLPLLSSLRARNTDRLPTSILGHSSGSSTRSPKVPDGKTQTIWKTSAKNSTERKFRYHRHGESGHHVVGSGPPSKSRASS